MPIPCVVIYKGKRFTKEQFMNELMKGELDAYLGKEFPAQLKPEQYAVQKPITEEGVLRQEGPQLELPAMGEGDKGAAAGAQAEKAPLSEYEAKRAKIKDDIDKLHKDINRKSGLSAGGQMQALPDIVKIVGKYFELGILDIGEIAKDFVARGATRSLPQLKKAYEQFIKSPEGQQYGVTKAPDLDYATMIEEANQKAMIEAEETIKRESENLIQKIQEDKEYKPPVGRRNVLLRGISAVTGAAEKAQSAIIGDRVRKAKELVNRKLEQRVMSPDKGGLASTIMLALDGLIRPISKERYAAKSEKLYGPIEQGKEVAMQLLDRAHEMFGMSRDQAERVHRVLDPEFYKVKSRQEWDNDLKQQIGEDNFNSLNDSSPDFLNEQYKEYFDYQSAQDTYKQLTYDELSENEKAYHDMMRSAGDLVHATNMKAGIMHYDTYTRNKGKYVPRMYEAIERGERISKDQTTRQNLDIMTLREEVNEWKLENRIKDPSYLMAKRIQQSYSNLAVADYANWVNETMPNVVKSQYGEIPKGYVQLGRGYGELSNKYVPLSIAEDFKGFQFISKKAQGLYDALKWYDSTDARSFYKQLFTVYNPVTQTGNMLSNVQFALLMGIDPINYVANKAWAINELTRKGDAYMYYLKKGGIRTSLTREDYTKAIDEFNGQVEQATNSRNPLKQMRQLYEGAKEKIKPFTDVAKKIYEYEDDTAKLAAWRSLVDMGKSADEAFEIVSKGMQNSKRLPKVYDLAARTPVISSPFARFKADMARILWTNATERPLTMIGYFYGLNALANVLSRASGETDDEKKIRESRAGSPQIPIINLPLEWRVGNSSLNVARYFSPYYTYETYNDEDISSALNKVLPYDYTPVKEDSRHPEGPWAAWFGEINKDPLTQALNLKWNADFLGRVITDPTATQKTGYTASERERWMQGARYLVKSYIPFGRDGLNVWDAVMMEINPNLKEVAIQQGQPVMNVKQAILKAVAGVKLQQMPESKYKQMLRTQVNNLAGEFENEAKKLNTIRKLYQERGLQSREAIDRLNEVFTKLTEIQSKINEFDASFNEEKYKGLKDQFFEEYDGYESAVKKFEEAMSDKESYLESRPQRRRSLRGRSGLGGGLGSGLGGGLRSGLGE